MQICSGFFFEGAFLDGHAWFMSWLYVTKKQVYTQERICDINIRKKFTDFRKIRVVRARRMTNETGMA